MGFRVDEEMAGSHELVSELGSEQATGRAQPACLSTLAASQAALGRFSEAAATASEALKLATAQGSTPLATSLAEQLARYEEGRPHVEEPRP